MGGALFEGATVNMDGWMVHLAMKMPFSERLVSQVRGVVASALAEFPETFGCCGLSSSKESTSLFQI